MSRPIVQLAAGAGISLALLSSSPESLAATTNVFIDPAWGWNGFQNVYHANGSFWTNKYLPPGDTAALQGSIDTAGRVVCAPDTRMDRDFHLDTNAWADASGASTGICTVVSTFYADSTAVASAGDTVVFSGMFISNSLAAPYSNSIIAFIKDFDSTWTSYGVASVKLETLTNGQSFAISKTIAAPGPGNHVQWGFEWSGPPARTNTVGTLGSAVLASQPKPRGASVPWVTIEAENMTLLGGTVIGPAYLPGLPATESSGRRCVRLNASGQGLEFTARAPANSLVVRYCVPDTAGGGGADFTLSLYKNGGFLQKLPMTSKYSWLYGAYPFTNSPASGSPRNFFDEVRVSGLTISSNDILRLSKDAGDTAAYYLIDLVDLEQVALPLAQPANSLSVSVYGAVGDGVTDCTTAFANCLGAAQAQGRAVWVPPGDWLITGTLNLPANTTLQGAGLWHSRLVGSASLYNTSPSRRIALNGGGSNIRLADFAILGWLNYRKDSEANDGLGGSFGTGSSINRVWVEHTKAGAWILNSQGLVVSDCRFRNLLADGINLNRGMQNTLVTNCTARGTGDDCFAVWPASGSVVYPDSQNVIAHCTGQVPFLANGGAIYGGTGNRIEDCRFEDIPYGCGILFSTTFPVRTGFGGTTAARRSDLVRCGGFDPGYGWRAALQFCMDRYGGIPGVDLDRLNLLDSVSDGLSVIGSTGALTNAVASDLGISGWGLGVGGRNALWARSEAAGSLTLSNSPIAEFKNDSPGFVFRFFPPPPPTFTRWSLNGGTNLVLTFSANPGNSYRIESAAAFLGAPWTAVPGTATNATWNLATLFLPFSPASVPRFYRVASP